MIALPPGCTINYEVTVVVNTLPDDFIEWWQEIEGSVSYTSYYTAKGKEIITPVLRYKQGRMSHKMAGQDEYLIRFKGEDAGAALMLLLKWDKLIIRHNMQEIDKLKEAHYG